MGSSLQGLCWVILLRISPPLQYQYPQASSPGLFRCSRKEPFLEHPCRGDTRPRAKERKMTEGLNIQQPFTYHPDFRVFAPTLHCAWCPETLYFTPSREHVSSSAGWGRGGVASVWGVGKGSEALTAPWAPNSLLIGSIFPLALEVPGAPHSWPFGKVPLCKPGRFLVLPHRELLRQLVWVTWALCHL